MDISNITNLVTLKSLAYDEIAKKEIAEANLARINARIHTVENAPAPITVPKAATVIPVVDESTDQTTPTE